MITNSNEVIKSLIVAVILVQLLITIFSVQHKEITRYILPGLFFISRCNCTVFFKEKKLKKNYNKFSEFLGIPELNYFCYFGCILLHLYMCWDYRSKNTDFSGNFIMLLIGLIIISIPI